MEPMRSNVLYRWGLNISKTNEEKGSTSRWKFEWKMRLMLGPSISGTKCDKDKLFFSVKIGSH